MIARSLQFPFVPRDPALGAASLAPLMPLVLGDQPSISVSGLLDSGAAVNVLPFSVGDQLGFDWDEQSSSVALSGNLASVEARVIVVSAAVGGFSPVRLAFAWTRSDETPVILGQVNFFMEFDVCFFRTRSFFEIRPKQGA